MSKIYEAYRKRTGDAPDLTIEIGRVGTLALFPMPDATQQDEFSHLSNRLLNLKRDDRGSVISFASSATGEGASFVSYNTALMLATVYHQRVAWIDANFLSPQKALMHADSPSFAALLQSPERLAELRPTGNLNLIPGGLNLPAVRGLFADQRCSELMRALRVRFDFAFIDLPPVQNSSDTALLAAETDGLLLVIEQRFLKREVINHGTEALLAKSVRILGAVINKRTYDLPKVIYDRL
jgi:Mrp family chromosome partitioning ATPase